MYSGKGIDNLRLYLAELMANVQADFTDETETDYDEEGDEEFRSSSEAEEQPDDAPTLPESLQTPRGVQAPQQSWTRQLTQGPFEEGSSTRFEENDGRDTTIRSEGENGRFSVESIRPVPSTVTTVRGRAARAIVERGRERGREGMAEVRPLIVEDTNPSSLATTPSPTVHPTPNGTPSNTITGRPRGFGQDLIVEPPTPSPQITPFASRVEPSDTEADGSSPVPTYVRTSSNASDGMSNRSSGTNTSAPSNGAGFFRRFDVGTNNVRAPASDGDAASARGVHTPDLVFAEIGHGRGRDSVIPQHVTYTRSSSFPEATTPSTRFRSDLASNSSDSFLPSTSASTSLAVRNARARENVIVVERSQDEEEHDPSSPIPYLSPSPTRELHESVHNALAGSISSMHPFPSHADPRPHIHGHSHSRPSISSNATGLASTASSPSVSALIQEDTDTRGRSSTSRRSLKSTFSSVADHFFRSGHSTSGGSSVGTSASAATALNAGEASVSTNGSTNARQRAGSWTARFGSGSG